MNATLAKNAENPNEIQLGDLCGLCVLFLARTGFDETLHWVIDVDTGARSVVRFGGQRRKVRGLNAATVQPSDEGVSSPRITVTA